MCRVGEPKSPTDANVPDGNRKPSRPSTRARREKEVVGQPLFIVDPVSCPLCPGLGRIVKPVARRERSYTYTTKEPEDGHQVRRAAQTVLGAGVSKVDRRDTWFLHHQPARRKRICEDAAVSSRRSSPLERHPGAAESPSHHSRHRGSHVRPKEPTRQVCVPPFVRVPKIGFVRVSWNVSFSECRCRPGRATAPQLVHRGDDRGPDNEQLCRYASRIVAQTPSRRSFTRPAPASRDSEEPAEKSDPCSSGESVLPVGRLGGLKPPPPVLLPHLCSSPLDKRLPDGPGKPAGLRNGHLLRRGAFATPALKRHRSTNLDTGPEDGLDSVGEPKSPTDANVPDGNRKPSRPSTRARREKEVVGQPLFIVDPVSCPLCPGLGRIVKPVARRERSYTYTTKEPEDGHQVRRAAQTVLGAGVSKVDRRDTWFLHHQPARRKRICEDAAVSSRRSSPLERHPGAAESPSHHSRHRGSHVRPKEPTRQVCVPPFVRVPKIGFVRVSWNVSFSECRCRPGRATAPQLVHRGDDRGPDNEQLCRYASRIVAQTPSRRSFTRPAPASRDSEEPAEKSDPCSS
ncbi:hypothetical protein GEV33_004118 [Tenebrio molitor]|uniref:Uncharacterized protein n=1 Tax=Tenebrio molitor TaxID=7067 RepID=A0A8J6HS77_TENMO|nr:hypothetical protein GEV33_004118 [Tenebrio molitor]